MSHYYSEDQRDVKSRRQTVMYTHGTHAFRFTTDHGVFSKDHVDTATSALLDHLMINADETVLDLGCGYGVIGIVIASVKGAQVIMSDVNERALALARENAEAHDGETTVIKSDGFDAIDARFDHIVTNPPIRIGKNRLYTMFNAAKAHLKPNGSLWLVMHKKHGALSAIAYLRTLYKVEVVAKHKGFRIIRCEIR